MSGRVKSRAIVVGPTLVCFTLTHERWVLRPLLRARGAINQGSRSMSIEPVADALGLDEASLLKGYKWWMALSRRAPARRDRSRRECRPVSEGEDVS